MKAKKKGRKQVSPKYKAAEAKMRRFAREWCVDFNGKRSAITAGYSARSAEVTASKLLRIPKVQDWIKECLKEFDQGRDVRLARLRNELELLAYSDADDIVDFSGEHYILKPANEIPAHARKTISTIKGKRHVDGTGDSARTLEEIEIKRWDKNRALVDLGRLDGAFLDKTAMTDPTGANEAGGDLTHAQRLARFTTLVNDAARPGRMVGDAPAGPTEGVRQTSGGATADAVEPIPGAADTGTAQPSG